MGVGPVSVLPNKPNILLNGYIFEYNQMLSYLTHLIKIIVIILSIGIDFIK
jgi:hypothetical protein